MQESVRDDDRAGRAGEHIAKGLDRGPVLGGQLADAGDVEAEGGMYDPVRVPRALAEDVRVAEGSGYRRATRGGQRGALLLRPDQASDGVPRLDQFTRDCGADPTTRAC